MELKDKYIDLNYEEISCSRNLTDGQFANGLQSFNFSITPSGGQCVIPPLSYFLIEYNWGDAKNKSNDYTATQALPQSKKIALQNNWVSCLYNASRFTLAQSEISVCNSSHAQAHTLKQRMKRNTEFFESLGYDLDGFDPDFSRRLARHCKDGLYHRDGLIDCSPYNSDPYSAENYGKINLYHQDETPLPKDANELSYTGSAFSTAVAPATLGGVANTYPFMSRANPFSTAGNIGTQNIVVGAVDLALPIVQTIRWELPDYSLLPGTSARGAGLSAHQSKNS